MRMRKIWLVLAAPLAIVATACGKQDSKGLDAALKNDLALASQAQPYNPQQIVSPTEQGLAAPGYAQNLQAVARQPVVAQPVRRTATVRRSSGSGASRSSGSGVYYPSAPAQPRVEKHTGRDAAIGAGAGAVIGAISSRDKVKGGLIGAAIGGILGGVVGNNVDVKRTPF
jgi:hypothetical protein